MQEMGADVLLYNEMSVNSSIERAMLKLSPNLFKRKTEEYYNSILNKIENKSFDYVLFIDCEMPTISVLKNFRLKFKKAKFCLHLWDSLNNLKGVNEKFKFFDYITSFDKQDANKYHIAFRPLFFCDEFRANSSTVPMKYNLSFIGTIHSDRFKIIKKINDQIDDFYVYPYLQSKFIYWFYKIVKSEFWDTHITDFKFKKLKSEKISKIVNKSIAVLDIQHPNQTGLTMRTLEMIGMKKKIITTNMNIMSYDIYNQNNICVIDRDNPIIPKNFLKSSYVDLEKEIYNNYSINQWIVDVLGVKKNG